MKIGIYEGVDMLVNALLKYHNKNKLNELLAECFPTVFAPKGQWTILQHLFTIALPIRDKFAFVLIYKDNMKDILGFGMMDYSNTKKIPLVKNVCRKSGIQWKGVGKHILQAIDNYSRSKKFRIISLNAENTQLSKYYNKFGWVQKDKLFMTKAL